jgi:hypothetical protein
MSLFKRLFETMSEFDKEDIGRLVREILAEVTQGRKDMKVTQKRAEKSDTGLRVLFLFNPGVRKLDEALEQVDLIDASVSKSGIYTGPSARQWVCGADVKVKTGARCILDTVTPEGVEKVLDRSDALVLPTMCLTVASKVANLMCDDQESRLVFTALLQEKKVLAANDGFQIYDILKNRGIQEEIGRTLSKLESFGMILSETRNLNSTFQGLFSKEKPAGNRESGSSGAVKSNSSVRLITSKVIYDAYNNNQSAVELSPDGMVTPLAADLAKEYGIKINRSTRSF